MMSGIRRLRSANARCVTCAQPVDIDGEAIGAAACRGGPVWFHNNLPCNGARSRLWNHACNMITDLPYAGIIVVFGNHCPVLFRDHGSGDIA